MQISLGLLHLCSTHFLCIWVYRHFELKYPSFLGVQKTGITAPLSLLKGACSNGMVAVVVTCNRFFKSCLPPFSTGNSRIKLSLKLVK